jgi:hypothetical protein
VHGEQFVVGLGLNQISLGCEKLNPQKGCEESADKKEKRDREEIKPGYPFMIRRE